MLNYTETVRRDVEPMFVCPECLGTQDQPEMRNCITCSGHGAVDRQTFHEFGESDESMVPIYWVAESAWDDSDYEDNEWDFDDSDEADNDDPSFHHDLVSHAECGCAIDDFLCDHDIPF